MNELLKKEIHSKYLLRIIKNDKNNDTENIYEYKKKHNQFRKKKKLNRLSKELLNNT